MTKHVMLDLETLGTNPDAPIVEIAFVEFDDKGKTYETLNAFVKPDFSKSLPDFNTLKWWIQQSQDARDRVFGHGQHLDMKNVLGEMNAFWWDKKDHNLWCHASFDAPILTTACRAYGVSPMWSHRNIRDIRTLEFLAPHIKETIERKGTHHSALDDCHYQIEHVIKMLGAI